MEKISVQKLKYLRSLKQKKIRLNEKKIIIEGDKIIQEAVRFFPKSISFILVTNEHDGTQYPVETLQCSISEMQKISSHINPPDAVALISTTFQNEINYKNKIVILDDIQDPGNLGTIIRTCDWFGVDRVLCSTNTVDVFNAKVIQSTMGSIFRVRIEYVDIYDFIEKSSINIVAATMNGEDYTEYNWSKVDAVVLGNEGKGISSKILPLINSKIAIPRVGKAESLNVSIAAGIILSKWI